MDGKKKFIAPGAWFSMLYPADWCEAEDGEGSFLFYNPEVWNGNLRISAYKECPDEEGAMSYGRESVEQELAENRKARRVKVGACEAAYSREDFKEDGQDFESHFWLMGVENLLFECSFTVWKGASVKPAEEVLASVEIRRDGVKYPPELIPVRLSEICLIDEGYEWTATQVKRQLSLDFQGQEPDLEKIQQVIDSGVIGRKKRDEWLALGIAVCVILTNEVDGMQWMTLVDGNREAPVLVRADGKMIDPMKLTWSRVKAGEPCRVREAYEQALE